jgi:septum formation protein
MAAPPQFVLASASPRRRDLLARIGRVPDKILHPEIDETPRKGELPRALAERLAREKARAIVDDPAAAGAFILAADTVVACGRRILPKPHDADAARACLQLLSGRRHRVLSGIAVVDPAGVLRVRVVTTSVTFKRLSEAEIAAYVAGGEWQDKAGGYAIQGRAATFVKSLNGSYTNVVGLPLFEVEAMLTGLGCPANPGPTHDR